MKNILIIEDEMLSAERLRQMLLKLDDTLHIDGPLTNVPQITEHLRTHNNYDLIFSDIRLGSHTVFEAFHEVMPLSFVIFTTAYDEFAMEAFQANGIDYLLKPFSIDDLRKAIGKLQLAHRADETNGTPLTGLARSLHCYQNRFLVYQCDALFPIHTDDVSCFVRNDRQVLVITPQGKRYTLSISLSELENKLDPSRFFRINRQYIANIDYIKKVSFFFNSKLKVNIMGCDDDKILVSKERSAAFKAWLNS